MATVKQLLEEKGYDVVSVSPDDNVQTAIQLMADRNIGALLVMENDKPVGIFTERHYARNVFLKGRASPTTLVRDAMETRVVCTRLDQSVEEGMALMSDKRVRHLPVLHEKRVVGMVSIGDLVKSVIAAQKFQIEQLEQYIHG